MSRFLNGKSYDFVMENLDKICESWHSWIKGKGLSKRSEWTNIMFAFWYIKMNEEQIDILYKKVEQWGNNEID